MPACSLCGLELSTKAILNRHMLGHSGGTRPFSCTICSKGFLRRDHLNKHHLIHSGVRPHKCEHCEYTAIDRSAIVKHARRLHSKQRDQVIYKQVYECKFCAKTFSTLSRLKGHIKLHSGNGLLNCDYCDKVFITKGDLDCHIKVHIRTKEDRWGCETCGRTYAWKRGLEHHKTKHCQGEASSEASSGDPSKSRAKNIAGGSKILSKGNHCSRSPAKEESDRESEIGVEPESEKGILTQILTPGKERSMGIERKRKETVAAPGRGILTCLLCRGEFLSLPDMYRHQCSGKPGSLHRTEIHEDIQ